MADNEVGPDNNDAEIIRLGRSESGESRRRALELLDQKYGPQVQDFAARALPSHARDAAVDVRQETNFAVLLKIEKAMFTENGSLRSLLFEIAKCKAIDICRRAARRREDSSVDVAAVAQAHYDNPQDLEELKQAIFVGCEELTGWQLYVFQTRMEFIRLEKRRPRFKKLAELVLGHTPTTKEIDAVKRTYYRASQKLKTHLTKTGHWKWK